MDIASASALPDWLPLALLAGAVAVLLLAAAVAWGRRSGGRAILLAELQQQLAERTAALQAAEAERQRLVVLLAEERRGAAVREASQREAGERMRETLQAMSAEALERNSRQFLDLAQASLGQAEARLSGEGDKRGSQMNALVAPLTQMLAQIESRLRELEQARVAAYAGLTQTVQALGDGQQALRQETQRLAQALSQPGARGRWGELQLRRVVELAGMAPHCDFSEQRELAETPDGSAIRPDLVIHLPGGRSIVVDAKVPLDGYLASLESPDAATRAAALKRHAAALRSHQRALGQKAYWSRFAGSAPDFTILFLPAEPILAAAAEADPQLLEAGAEQQVLIATPMTLIAMLRAVAQGWRQERLAENALAMRSLGAELAKRLADLNGHVAKVGRALSGSVTAYNAMLGTLESRVLVTARRFQALQDGEDRAQTALPLPPPVDLLPRPSVEAAE